MNKRTNEQKKPANEWMKERTNEWMKEWMNERMNKWTSERINESMNEWIWMNYRTTDRTNETKWMGEWSNDRTKETNKKRWVNWLRTNAEMNEWIKLKESYTHHIFCNRMRRTLLSRCGTRFIFIGLFPSRQFLPVSSWGSYNGPVLRALHHNLFPGPPQGTLSHVSSDTAVCALHIYFEFRVLIWW